MQEEICWVCYSHVLFFLKKKVLKLWDRAFDTCLAAPCHVGLACGDVPEPSFSSGDSPELKSLPDQEPSTCEGSGLHRMCKNKNGGAVKKLPGREKPEARLFGEQKARPGEGWLSKWHLYYLEGCRWDCRLPREHHFPALQQSGTFIF